MKLKKIFVRAVKGRIARTEPRGRYIPSEGGILVALTPYIDRLLNVHKDIEEVDDPERPPPRSTKPKRPVVPDTDAPADKPQTPVAIED